MNRPAIEYAMERFKNRNDLIIAEIGVAAGGNAYNMLKAFPQIKNIVLVDPYIKFGNGNDNDFTPQERQDIIKEQMFERLKEFEHKKVFIHQTSKFACELMLDNYFDFIYIDGDHSYKAVLEDIKMWYPKVKIDGFIAGHDYNTTTGVSKAVDEFCKNNSRKVKFFTTEKPTTDNSDWLIDKGFICSY